MNLDEVKQRFVQEIELRAYDDKYIDKNEEREILQIAIGLGVTVDSARASLAQVCERHGYILESVALKQAKELMDTFATNDGKIDEKEFNDAVTTLKKATQGKRNDVQCKRMILEIMADNSYQPKTGWLSNWYANVKKQVGM
jgi:hypothetical protein